MQACCVTTCAAPARRNKTVRQCSVADGAQNYLRQAKMKLQVERWDADKYGKLSTKTMLKRLRAEGYSGSTYQFPPGTRFPSHAHNCDKKDSIITGRFKFVSKDQGEVTLEPGDMLHVPKGMEHSAETVGKETVTFVDASRI